MEMGGHDHGRRSYMESFECLLDLTLRDGPAGCPLVERQCLGIIGTGVLTITRPEDNRVVPLLLDVFAIRGIHYAPPRIPV